MRRRLLLGTALAAPLAAPAAARAQAPGFALPVLQDDRVAPGFRREALLRWGDRVLADAPPFAPDAPDPEAAAAQLGWDLRVCGIAVPPRAADGVPRGVLAVAHPSVDAAMAWPGGADRPAVAAAMQGASLLNLERRGGRWVVVDGGFQSRRLTAATLCRLAGPAAGEGSGVLGVLGVTGGGVTPWGSLLLAEGAAEAWARRLAPADPRFADPAAYGWVVELDPLDPQSVPVKRTALGRMAHGDAAAGLGGAGQAVVFLCDRRMGGMLYRFVSAGPATAPDALDEGSLFVARIEGAGLRWLPLPAGTARDPAGAGRAAGGSGLDAPSGLALDPRRARLLVACRGASAGQVLEFLPEGGDLAGPGGGVASLLATGPRAGGAWPDAPDSLAIDGKGRAWIGTNHGGQIRDQAAGLFLCALDGPGRGQPVAIYGAPRGAAIGGAATLPPEGGVGALAPEGGGAIIGVRHPGLGPGQDFARPGTRWPQFAPGVPPRSTLVALAEG